MSDPASFNAAGLTAGIVSAYVSKNSLPAAELPNLIDSVHAALAKVISPPARTAESPAKATADQIKKSMSPDHLISFIDGRRYRTLKRHLAKHGLTPEQYRMTFGLPATYPMVAEGLSAARSDLARTLRLGHKRAKRAAAAE
ncbi:MAG: MucR family transcriptional regulator [Methylobacterium sp.]|jgi:predicted transcriptional regulator|uniref:MucR family transcriptional regulator n=1 Tax=Methylobacterium sp. TaxID=409 RepID=UPI00258CF86C|nr:MucR family transcriptional regulator [Methylobacterium sp.]MBY0296217.1 MucR family transcriptional regulator [Methylobacterium sp.]